VTITLFSFLLSLDQRETRRVEAIQWSLLVLLALLLSSTTGIYHPTVLIFTAVVAGDALLVEFDKNRALLVMLLFVIACAYVPANVARFFPLSRLAAMTALYVLLIHAALAGHRVAVLRWMPAALVVVTLLTLGNLRFVVDRAEDYQRRLASPWAGYGSANPVPLANGIAFRAMQQKGYIVQVLQNGELTHVFGKGNMLSLSAAKSSAFLYLEIAAQKSFITRLPVSRLGGAAETQTPGQDPALSPDGRWLAFIREDGGQSSAWLLATDMRNAPQPVLLSSYHPLDLTVSSNGDLIASAGPVSESYLVVVRRATQKVELLRGISRPARYPSVSPDSERLAYSRRDHGFWHLIVHDFATGAERQLTHGACNAISASWQDDETLLYATDCGRGVGLSAVAQVHIPQ
jgi:dipeptidyl aminopeptidase/acylaminoacyl peptidase